MLMENVVMISFYTPALLLLPRPLLEQARRSTHETTRHDTTRLTQQVEFWLCSLFIYLSRSISFNMTPHGEPQTHNMKTVYMYILDSKWLQHSRNFGIGCTY